MMNGGVPKPINNRMTTSLRNGFESNQVLTVSSGILTALYSAAQLYSTKFCGTRPINTNQVPSTSSVAPTKFLTSTD